MLSVLLWSRGRALPCGPGRRRMPQPEARELSVALCYTGSTPMSCAFQLIPRLGNYVGRGRVGIM